MTNEKSKEIITKKLSSLFILIETDADFLRTLIIHRTIGSLLETIREPIDHCIKRCLIEESDKVASYIIENLNTIMYITQSKEEFLQLIEEQGLTQLLNTIRTTISNCKLSLESNVTV